MILAVRCKYGQRLTHQTAQRKKYHKFVYKVKVLDQTCRGNQILIPSYETLVAQRQNNYRKISYLLRLLQENGWLMDTS